MSWSAKRLSLVVIEKRNHRLRQRSRQRQRKKDSTGSFRDGTLVDVHPETALMDHVVVSEAVVVVVIVIAKTETTDYDNDHDDDNEKKNPPDHFHDGH
jgi:hypothetical protein